MKPSAWIAPRSNAATSWSRFPCTATKNSLNVAAAQRRSSSLRSCANGRPSAPLASPPPMPEATPQTRGPAARLLRDWFGFEFVSRIYLYSVLIGLISGLGAVLFTYGLALAKFPASRETGWIPPAPSSQRGAIRLLLPRRAHLWRVFCGYCCCCRRWVACSAAT